MTNIRKILTPSKLPTILYWLTAIATRVILCLDYHYSEWRVFLNATLSIRICDSSCKRQNIQYMYFEAMSSVLLKLYAA